MNRENQGIIARKYAKAFIDLFSNKLDIQIPEDIDKIKMLMSYIDDHHKSLTYADLKLLNTKIKQDVFHNLIDKFGLKSEFKKLTDLLILHKRTFLLYDILRFILEMYLDKNDTILFNIFSSHHLSDVQKNTLIKFLESRSNKKVIIKSQIDPHLIAGIKAISNEFEWEHSIRKKLNSINQT